MDWVPLVNSIVSPIVAVCGVATGLILGVAGTLFIHTRLMRKQRQWMLEDQERRRQQDLDDRRRDWEKERLTHMLAQVNRLSSLVYHTSLALEEGEETQLNAKVQELKDTLSQIDSTFDEELSRLFEDFNNAIFSAVRTQDTDILKEGLFLIRQRINVLLTNCYK